MLKEVTLKPARPFNPIASQKVLGGGGFAYGQRTFQVDCLVVIHRGRWQAHFVKLGPALDDQVYRIFGQQLRGVIHKRFHVHDRDVLIDMGSRGLGCVYCGKLHIGVRLVFRSTDGQRSIEGIKSRMVSIVVGKNCVLLEVEGIWCRVG